MGTLKTQIEDGSQQAAQTAATYMGDYSTSVTNAMDAGAVATGKGFSQMIVDELNKALKALGQKELTNIQVGSVKLNVGKQTGDLASGRFAVGGVVGNWGERGPDAIPIMVGRGEAVLNNPQQQIANQYLAPIGGLPGLFSSTSGMKHMAGGGYVTGGPTLNYGQLEGLWESAGGPKNVAAIMAAIAMAESGGVDQMQQGQPAARRAGGIGRSRRAARNITTR